VIVGVGVMVGVGVIVGVMVGVLVGVGVSVRVGVAVGTGVGVLVGLALGMGVGVALGMGVGVANSPSGPLQLESNRAGMQDAAIRTQTCDFTFTLVDPHCTPSRRQAFFPQMRHPQSRSPSTALFQYTDQLMSNPTSYSIISTEMIALQRRGL